MVKDIRTREPDYGVSQMIAFGNTLYFTVADNSHGHELWKSDGTAIGTVMVKDIRSDSTSSIHISLGVVIGNSLYFTADDRTHGKELWKSDGTETGTVMVEDVRVGSPGSWPGWLTVFGNALYFSADDGESGDEVWKYSF